ncbi:MAG: AraC family transcriptional regulator [Saprospiraceae bacterium]|uniref:AraC family transcriptional regulator n=1 Tax=Candidatus Opimibacter skivensis TaxID=2982028 RepID=A0A9D7SQ99_9BACT|nr:AraC family transcriptional regulator [Candidatus Opimibacter skivensis]
MLYLSGITISFFLALVLLTKKYKSHADYILMAWLIILGFHLVTFYFFFTNQQLDIPLLIVIGMPLPLVHGPFLYLYTHQQTSAFPFNKKQLLHFMPPLLSYMMFGKFYFLTHEEQTDVFRLLGKGFEVQSMINLYAIYISGIVYVTLSLVRLLKYRRNMVQQFSNTERINFNWLLYLIIWMVILWTIVLFVQQDNLIFGVASLFVLWIGYFGIKQVQVFTQRPLKEENQQENKGEATIVEKDIPIENELTGNLKYQKSTLTEDEAFTIQEKLNTLMTEQKPYKDPDLTLDDLAKKLDIHPNYLSQVINSRENKTFYDLVNEKRVNAFIKNITHPASQQYTMLAVALDCGFNSKASFNRNFKKYTGYTPSEYLKMALVLPPTP